MAGFFGPATKRVDAQLFSGAGVGARRLLRQARKELRDKARALFWQDAQQQKQQQTDPSDVQDAS